jgi:hypothetical protein
MPYTEGRFESLRKVALQTATMLPGDIPLLLNGHGSHNNLLLAVTSSANAINSVE